MIKLDFDEKIIKVVRRHFFIMIPIIVGILVMAIIPLLIYQIFTSDFLSLNETIREIIVNFIDEWNVFAYSLWLLILWGIFFVEWTDYYLDTLIVTNKRIIETDQKGFFNREVTSYLYPQIQDITVETQGVIRTLFKFGNLHIQTAGVNHEIIVKDATHPELIRSLILSLQSRNFTTLI